MLEREGIQLVTLQPPEVPLTNGGSYILIMESENKFVPIAREMFTSVVADI
jgi:hypothetical protein